MKFIFDTAVDVGILTNDNIIVHIGEIVKVYSKLPSVIFRLTELPKQFKPSILF